MVLLFGSLGVHEYYRKHQHAFCKPKRGRLAKVYNLQIDGRCHQLFPGAHALTCHIYIYICCENQHVNTLYAHICWYMSSTAWNLGIRCCWSSFSKVPWLGRWNLLPLIWGWVFSRYALGLSLKIPMNLQCYAAMVGWGKIAKYGHWKTHLKGRMTIPHCQDFEAQFCGHRFKWPHLKS